MCIRDRGITASDGNTIYGITNPNRYAERVPTVAFTHEHVDPATIAGRLGELGICVWSGHNYAYEVVRHISIPEESGVVRVGPAHYNTLEEAYRLGELLPRGLREG